MVIEVLHSTTKKKNKHNMQTVIIDEFKILHRLRHMIGDPIPHADYVKKGNKN